MGKLEYLEFQEAGGVAVWPARKKNVTNGPCSRGGGVAVWPAREKNVASGPRFRMRGEAIWPARKKSSPGGGPRGVSGHSVENMGQIFLVNLL